MAGTDSGTLVHVVEIVGAVLSGGGIVATVNALARRRVVKVDATRRFSDGVLKWVDEFQAEAAEARREAAEARRESNEARREVVDIRKQFAEISEHAEALNRHIRELHAAILHPAVTIDRLRAMVPSMGTNGMVDVKHESRRRE